MTETVGAALVRSHHVLLGLRAAHKSFAGCWDIIGGHVEAGETKWSALCRELFEEIGVSQPCGDSIGTLTRIDPARPALLHVYAIWQWDGEPAIVNDEHTELRWFCFDELRCLTKLAVPQYIDLLASPKCLGAYTRRLE